MLISCDISIDNIIISYSNIVIMHTHMKCIWSATKLAHSKQYLCREITQEGGWG